ncbi:hypothetical protein [Bacteroides congonensis]
MSEYVKYGTNIVCTNMTSGVPQEIGTEPRECLTLSDVDKPILRIVDCKISGCFNCKIPQMKWGGLCNFLVGILIGAAIAVAAVAVIGAVVATGGAAAAFIAGVSAVIIPAGEVMVGAALVIGTASLCTSSFMMGYETKHLCDESLGAKWAIPQPYTIIEGEPAFTNNSFLPCLQKGIITIIVDDELAAEAARMISSKNNEIISREMLSLLFQGMVSGTTGGANPVALVVTAIHTTYDFCTNSYGSTILNNHEDILAGNNDYSYDYEGKTIEIIENTAGGEVMSEVGHKLFPKINGGTYTTINEGIEDIKSSNAASQAANEASQKAADKAARRAAKLNNNSSTKMQNRYKTAENHSRHLDNLADDAAQTARNAKFKLAGNITGIALGYGGSLANMMIDGSFKDDENNIEIEMIRNLQEIRVKDLAESKIISNE